MGFNSAFKGLIDWSDSTLNRFPHHGGERVNRDVHKFKYVRRKKHWVIEVLSTREARLEQDKRAVRLAALNETSVTTCNSSSWERNKRNGS
jgi:hypothetical protein